MWTLEDDFLVVFMNLDSSLDPTPGKIRQHLTKWAGKNSSGEVQIQFLINVFAVAPLRLLKLPNNFFLLA